LFSAGLDVSEALMQSTFAGVALSRNGRRVDRKTDENATGGIFDGCKNAKFAVILSQSVERLQTTTVI